MNETVAMNGDNEIGRIIMIPNDYTIVVDAGINTLSLGDRIVVYEVGALIKDSEGEILGTFDFEKAVLEVVEVQGGYSICKDKSIVKTNKLSAGLSPLFQEVKSVSYSPLPVSDEDNLNLSIKNKLISVGDPIKRL